MKLNPTFPEIILTLLFGLAFYIWVKYGKRIRRWWKDLHKRYRRPRQLKPREPGDCPLCARGIHQPQNGQGVRLFPGHKSKAHVVERSPLILQATPV
jgi:hypothetical protein